ncbi:MAG: hypothetical protein HYR73_08095 [Candidatus Eisenbacteria bacterium]|nr:hypothetical protein [Candidatus Eisenbacteria bacterium]
MRRAILLTAAVMLASALAGPAHAQFAGGFEINGIGLIDYGRRPDFKVGTWTRYHVTGQTSMGHVDDYVVTVGVAGEERFWGEDCFWVETETSSKTGGSSVLATLMSYSVFDDSLPFPHMQFYMRKNINDVDAQGQPLEMISRRPPASIRQRNRVERDLKWYIDTLGVDSVHIALGSYLCKRVHIRQDVQVEADKGDSTTSDESKEDRDSYVSRQVPLTGIVREDIDFKGLRTAWLIGRSKDAPTVVLDHSTGRAELVGFGYNYRGQMVPESKRSSIREQERAAAPTAPAAPASKSKSTHKSG